MKNEIEPEKSDYFIIVVWALILLTVVILNSN